MIIVSLIFIALMFLAWAIGGEYRFGKGKRGLLLAIPLTLFGLGKLPWWGLAIQIPFLYGIYQCLKYDPGISMVYDKNDKRGWWIIYLNGAMIGLTALLFSVSTGHLGPVFSGLVAGILGFSGVVRLANDKKFEPWRTWLAKNGLQRLPYKDDKGNLGYYINFKDAWWVCEGIMGAILALTLVLAW